MIGKTLGHYRITAPIGAGGMGEVYRATDTRLGRDVALKMLPADMAADPERLERFQREARTLASLNHPNIVTIFSVEESGETRFLAMELIEGETLDTVIAEGGLPLSRFLDISVPLADAISAAHERGIVHRDLKPGNVMVTREGRVKVLDFGLARLGSSDSNVDLSSSPTGSRANLTDEGQVFGTVAYMSPEQARGAVVDVRSDVFSLGVVLYQMLTGERPFRGTTAVDIITSILRDKPPSVTELRADLPPHLARVLRRCLEKVPRDRYQTSRDVYNELNELRAETSSASPGSSPRAEGRSLIVSSGSLRPSAVTEDEGFRVAVLPFKFRGADQGLEVLAGGMSEEIVAGLSRFSFLRVITAGSTQRYAAETPDLREVGRELGVRYVMNGSLRQVGARLRIAVQLVDAATGAQLWAETYERPFRAEEVFELQDEVVSRIVSTVGDPHGILPHTMSESLRASAPDRLTPYEAVLRSFGFGYRSTPEEHAAVRAALERAVAQAPGYADALAMLSLIYTHEHAHGFNPLPDPLGRALKAARSAADAAPSNAVAYDALAWALFFRKEYPAFRVAAEQSIALNPLSSPTLAGLGTLIAYSGEWEKGCALVERALQLNPRHPGWYRFALLCNAYRKGDYRGAADMALKLNLPDFYVTHEALVVAYGQLGEHEEARRALGELLRLKPDYPATAREKLEKWFDPAFVEHWLDGVREAGLDVLASPQ